MKLLGVDFGLKRVGLAVTDPDGTMAFPLATLERSGRDALFAELLSVIAREGVEAVVVGYPAPPDGVASLTARQAANFARSLARRTPLPVSIMDETLSSQAAQDDLAEAGVKPGRRGKILDQQAAVRILESYLAGREPSR